MDETIYALSSGKGRAGVAVIRVSGPRARATLATLSGAKAPQPRVAALRRLSDPKTGALIDRGLVLFFPAPHSFTGEDVAEFHVHGGRAVLLALTHALAELGLRAAAAGEFTRRAFEHGRMDLAEAEGLADLIEADSDSQRLQALAQMGGRLREAVNRWDAALVTMLARADAAIDFTDEADVPDTIDRAIPELARGLAAEAAQALAPGRSGEIIRDGLRAVLVGAPNAGKSTLLNALAGREAAIVSDTPGTTRDVITTELDCSGYVVRLSDMAGLRVASDAIEREGVRRALAEAEGADLRIAVLDGARQAETDIESALRFGLETESLMKPGDLVVLTKADLVPAGARFQPGGQALRWISAKTGEGIDALLAELGAAAAARAAPPGAALITRARHREAFQQFLAALAPVCDSGRPVELVAEDLRMARRALARIQGRADVEAVLDAIFAEFCIGK